MKKKLFSLTLAVAAVFALPAISNAQNIGGLLNKGKKVASKITGKEEPKEQQARPTENKVTPVIFANGVEMINPIAESITIEPVGLYGISAEESPVGDVYLVMKVTLKEPKNKTNFGSSIRNQKMIAVDAAGNVYNIPASGSEPYDTPQDVPVIVNMGKPGIMFTNVSTDLKKMDLVKVGVFIDAYHQDNIIFKNFPIQWNPTEEDKK
ncbi:MAG: hypothetical protein K2M79_05550 [Muribaculaceae bacterium]|nr:hypothetical protein [Muribaculaceae bacterium]